MDNIILIFILAHFICDFVTQTDTIIKKKHEYAVSFLSNKGLIEHVIHHIVVTVILLTIFNQLSWIPLVCLFIIAISHYIIDHFKSRFSDVIIKKAIHKQQFIDYLLGKRSIHFLTDQFLHVVIIFLVLFLFNRVASFPDIIAASYKIFIEGVSLQPTTILLTLSIFTVLLTFTSSVLISELLKDMKQANIKKDEIASTLVKKDEDLFFQSRYSQLDDLNKNISVERTWEKEDKHHGKETMKMEFQQFNEVDDNSAGKYIGILERSLIGIFIVTGAYQGLIIIAALKTLTRFKQFDDKNFAEYYLIGTFLSILCALIIGLFIRSIWLSI